jgi:hypothetical protein
MSRAYTIHEEKRNSYRVLVGKPEGKMALEKSRR